MKRNSIALIGFVIAVAASLEGSMGCGIDSISVTEDCAEYFTCETSSSGAGGVAGGGGSSCMPPIPEGWTGYYAFIEEPFGVESAPCADGLKPSIYYFNETKHPGCTTTLDISCNAPQIRCGAPDGIQQESCVNPTLDIVPGALDYTKCFDSTEATSTSVFDELRRSLFTNCEILDGGSVASCTCTSMLVPPASQPWQSQTSICLLPESADSSCIEKPNSPALLCILHSGIAECPVGLAPHVVFSEYTDERDCSVCTCTNTECKNGYYAVHKTLGCASSMPRDMNYKCADKTSLGISNDGDWSIKPIEPIASGGASGGTPIGSVVGTGEVTFCCTQP